jgi:hypothetical protein
MGRLSRAEAARLFAEQQTGHRPRGRPSRRQRDNREGYGWIWSACGWARSGKLRRRKRCRTTQWLVLENGTDRETEAAAGGSAR